MGSLMAGWSSAGKDFRSEKFQRNKSLTKEEIESYWKSKKMNDEEHLTVLSDVQTENQMNGGSADKFQRSISFPIGGERKMNYGDENILTDELKKRDGWWTRSNWAFLNEPPVTAMEGPSYKYAAQYHVANIGRSKTVNNPEMMSY
ncbi:uncharacterized protein LOC110034989 isoform X2 [Phalaenopsis equestris]|uniref:uncharacterized protein LOC110034989 isoform X2 n=1 Tax=Phalaenopsis equestris TaxID=78828 RepID=UPI0009E630F1|nr:uncharacterized protein LOC110034989 isoform X2 [Phalaenopsis equestris]